MSRTELARAAVRRASDLRTELNYPKELPICPLYVAERLGLDVRFVPQPNLAGIYHAASKTILVSAMRPWPHRVFTLAHEIGHHIFGHQSVLDEIMDELDLSSDREDEEFLADRFAAELLMPTIAVLRAFKRRKIDPKKCSPTEFYAVACQLGVGYTTLITHALLTLRIIDGGRAKELGKTSPRRLRASVTGVSDRNMLVIADQAWENRVVDLEVGDSLAVPQGCVIDTTVLEVTRDSPEGMLFCATRAGIARVFCLDSKFAVPVRVGARGYTGLALYRTMEDSDE